MRQPADSRPVARNRRKSTKLRNFRISGKSGISRFRQMPEISYHGVRIGRLSRGIRHPGAELGRGAIRAPRGLCSGATSERAPDFWGRELAPMIYRPPHDSLRISGNSGIPRFRQISEIPDHGVRYRGIRPPGSRIRGEGVGAVQTMGSGGVRHEAENPQGGNPTEIPEMQTRTSPQKTTKMRPEIL